MKFSKKFLMTASFVLGIAILTTSAFADMIMGSGYAELKQALKDTYIFSEYVIDESYTVEASFQIKDHDKLLVEEKNCTKLDIENNRRESSSYSFDAGIEREYSYYNYADADMSYTENSYGEKNVYLRDPSYEFNVADRYYYNSAEFENVFETEEAKDIENILDAFVGNLSSLVQMEDTGNYIVYQGSIDSTQIPTYANAIASFLIKQGVFDSYRYSENENVPKIKGQVYISEINGKAVESKDGYISDLMANAILMGTDEDGVEHTFTMDFFFSLSNVGSTIIEVPDTTGAQINEAAKVEEVTYHDIWMQMYPEDAGVYIGGITEYVDNVPTFIGTSTLTITSVSEDGSFTGEYAVDYIDDKREEYKDFKTMIDCEYEEISEFGYLGMFEYFDGNGEAKVAVISRNNEATLSVCPDVKVSVSRGNSSTKGIAWEEPEILHARIK